MRMFAGVLAVVVVLGAVRWTPLRDDDDELVGGWRAAAGCALVGIAWGCAMFALQANLSFLWIGPLVYAPLVWVTCAVVRRYRRQADRRDPTVW